METSIENAKIAKVIKIGSRKSTLAMTQTHWVVNELKSIYPSIRIEIVSMSTVGDKILDKSLSKTGEKSLFTKELEDALLAKKVDMVVNSLKDMPSTLPSNLTISAVSKREDPRDAVIMHPNFQSKTLEDLQPGSLIGTSSLRRVAQLKKLYSHLEFVSIRGNLNTRLHKLDSSNKFSAIILAVAGVKRLKWDHRISSILSPEQCLYAVGQGALAIETRMDDQECIRLVSKLHHRDTVIRTIAERAFLKTLGGGCSVPQAVHSWIEEDELYMRGGVFNLDGSKSLVETMQTSLNVDSENDIIGECEADNCTEIAAITTTHRFINHSILKASGHLGRDLALLLISKGAKAILEEARRDNNMKEDRSY